MAIPPALKENPQFGVGQFGANAAFDGLLGLRFAWGTTFGVVLPNIDDALARLSKGGGGGAGNLFGPDFNLFRSASLKMLENIGHGLTHTQAAAAEKYITEAWAFEGIGSVIERVAEDAVHTRKLIRHRSKPVEIVRVTQPNVRAQLRPVARRADVAAQRAEAAEKRAQRLEVRLARLERAAAHSHAVPIPLPGPRPDWIEREIARLKGKVGRIGKIAGLGAFLILLAKALEKMGASWIRCGNVKRYGRRICGMDTNLLDAILAESFLIAGAISLRGLAERLLAVQEDIVGGVLRSISEVKGATGAGEGGYAGWAAADGKT